MTHLKQKETKGFEEPTKLPTSKEEATFWQEENKKWWESNPMRYDWGEKIQPKEFSKEFYQEIDKRFFENAGEYLKNEKKSKLFDEFVNFSELQHKDVLEIGVGNGSHAQLLALSAKSFTGIDLTEYAVKSTKERFNVFTLKGDVRRMDAEKLEFPNDSFDFVWSWGVIHHSSNTSHIISEIQRVLRLNGSTCIMVYHRGWWNYYIAGFLRWVTSSDFFKGISFSQSFQRHTDGALARYYTRKEFSNELKKYFSLKRACTRGPKSDIILIPHSKLKTFLMNLLPTNLNIFLTDTLQMGTFLICEAELLEKNKK